MIRMLFLAGALANATSANGATPLPVSLQCSDAAHGLEIALTFSEPDKAEVVAPRLYHAPFATRYTREDNYIVVRMTDRKDDDDTMSAELWFDPKDSSYELLGEADVVDDPPVISRGVCKAA
jgi:hypothetical protein